MLSSVENYFMLYLLVTVTVAVFFNSIVLLTISLCFDDVLP